VPLDLRERVIAAAIAAWLEPEDGAALVAEAETALTACQPDDEFTICFGILGERLGYPEAWVTFWNDLHIRLPLQQTPIKHLMRKFRRDGFVAYGIEKLEALYPLARDDVRQRMAFFAGLEGLGYVSELDLGLRRIRLGVLDDIKLDFAAQLHHEARHRLAMSVLLKLSVERQTDPSVVAFRKTVMLPLLRNRQKAGKPKLVVPRSEVIPTLLRHAAALTRPREPDRGIGPVVFFTGQLGAGGAERQMSRLSVEMHRREQAGEAIGRQELTGPIHVCLRNADPSRGSDFFLPVLRQAGLEPTLIDPMPLPGNEVLQGYSAEVQALLPMLRKGMREMTLKLIPYFREIKPEVAYLWQDGGAMAAGLAALLTGTPRVVVSFRGLPPDKRPDRMRDDMPTLFKEMFKLPQVTLSANSAAVACDYEAWLGLPAGAIAVIPNAVQDLPRDGDAADQKFWDAVVARSPECNRTVAGLFRFEPNKRPQTWVEAAAYVRRDPTVRFLMLGTGVEAARCALLVERLGMSDRIFMAGNRKHVGFYLNRCNLLLHLAETEGLPNAIIEAQMCGLPVLATPAGGTGEVVHDGVTGRLLPSAATVEVDTIVAALDDLLSDPVLLGRMGRAATELSLPRFNIDSVLSATVDLFAASPANRHTDEAVAPPQDDSGAVSRALDDAGIIRIAADGGQGLFGVGMGSGSPYADR